MDDKRHEGETRRRLLSTLCAGTLTVAGCLGGDSDENGGENGGENGEENGGENGDDERGPDTDASGVPVLGDPNSSVTLEVYQDLNCPGCRTFNELGFPEIESRLIDPGRVRYEHRDLPVTGDAAEAAAHAAREVFGRHGNEAFWSYRQEIYDNQDRLNEDVPAALGELADAIGFDGDAVEAAAANSTHEAPIKTDIDRANELGADENRMPNLFVNGERVDINQFDIPQEAIQSVVDQVEQAEQSS